MIVMTTSPFKKNVMEDFNHTFFFTDRRVNIAGVVIVLYFFGIEVGALLF